MMWRRFEVQAGHDRSLDHYSRTVLIHRHQLAVHMALDRAAPSTDGEEESVYRGLGHFRAAGRALVNLSEPIECQATPASLTIEE